jgi:flagellar hook assembly protein FlgD
MLGQEVRTLVDGHKPAGYQKVIWNGRDEAGRQLESGTYFIRLKAGRSVITRKLTLLK